jgi:hypothetical protein
MEPSEAASSVKQAQAVILPLAYFPPLLYFKSMLGHKRVIFDLHEHFHKQFYYNRCVVAGPNGILKLTIPILHTHKRMAIKEVRISYENNWQTLHWRSLEAAYRRSPYFEFYEHYFAPIFSGFKPEFLFEWDMKLFETMNTIFENAVNFTFTTEYMESYPEVLDLREWAAPNVLAEQPGTNQKYQQVFEERQGFIGNLSIIDLLFCEGPHSIEYLRK